MPGNDEWEYFEAKFEDTFDPVRAIVHEAKELQRNLIGATHLKVGCFRFDDGTTQNWSLNQAYTSDPPLQQLKIFGGFSLSNSASLALRAKADPFVVDKFAAAKNDPGDKVSRADIYLESPDLVANSDWQEVAGFSLDLQAWLWSAKYQLPAKGLYFAQLQMRVVEPNGTPHHYSEWDSTKDDFLFHPVQNGKPHHFQWKAPILEEATGAGYKVKDIRVRLTTPVIQEWEGGVHAEWLIGNVCPER